MIAAVGHYAITAPSVSPTVLAVVVRARLNGGDPPGEEFLRTCGRTPKGKLTTLLGVSASFAGVAAPSSDWTATASDCTPHGRAHHRHPGAHPYVIVVAELLRDDGGEVIGTNGFYVDVTFPPEERESFISESIAEIAANRAVIEQVKGILMIVYRIDADAAFDLLIWRSQAANIKLRVLAEQLLARFPDDLHA